MQMTKVDLARVELAANCIRRSSKFELDGIDEIMALAQGFTWLVEMRHRIAEDLQRQELQAKQIADAAAEPKPAKTSKLKKKK